MNNNKLATVAGNMVIHADLERLAASQPAVSGVSIVQRVAARCAASSSHVACSAEQGVPGAGTHA